MNGRRQGWERRFDEWCGTCERIMLRALLFGIFAAGVWRFVHWLLFN